MDLSIPEMDGDVHPAYDSPRSEIIERVPARCRRVLDVGCGGGAIGAALRPRGHVVTGIEVDARLAARARDRLDHVIEVDVEAAAAGPPLGSFDCIILADVLEHLRDPWAAVRWSAGMLDPDGVVIVSVPNVRHIETFWSLLARKRWPYRAIGIFDRTHLRFFARANLPDLFTGTDLGIVEIHRQPMLVLDPSSRWNRLAPYLGDFGALQFVVVARPTGR